MRPSSFTGAIAIARERCHTFIVLAEHLKKLELWRMPGLFVFSPRPAGMGGLVAFGGGASEFSRRKKNTEKNAKSRRRAMRLSSRFLPVLRSKTGKNQPGVALEHLK